MRWFGVGAMFMREWHRLKKHETFFKNCKLSNDISKKSLIATLIALGDLA